MFQFLVCSVGLKHQKAILIDRHMNFLPSIVFLVHSYKVWKLDTKYFNERYAGIKTLSFNWCIFGLLNRNKFSSGFLLMFSKLTPIALKRWGTLKLRKFLKLFHWGWTAIVTVYIFYRTYWGCLFIHFVSLANIYIQSLWK